MAGVPYRRQHRTFRCTGPGPYRAAPLSSSPWRMMHISLAACSTPIVAPSHSVNLHE